MFSGPEKTSAPTTLHVFGTNLVFSTNPSTPTAIIAPANTSSNSTAINNSVANKPVADESAGSNPVVFNTPLASQTLASSVATVHDTNSGLTYEGYWTHLYDRDSGDVNDDIHLTASDGDAVSYTFTGTGISYITETGPDEGHVQVYLDGALQAVVNCVSKTRKFQQIPWHVTGLSRGSHTLELVKADGRFMMLDALQVASPPAVILSAPLLPAPLHPSAVLTSSAAVASASRLTSVAKTVPARTTPSSGPSSGLADYPSTTGVAKSPVRVAEVASGTNAKGIAKAVAGASASSYSGTAYNGPHTLPGTVQFEDYDQGGEGVGYQDSDAGNNGGAYRSDDVDIENCGDTGGGFDVGWTVAGEYLRYSVQAQSAGTYAVTFRVASPSGGGTFHLEDETGANLTGSVTAPATGNWEVFTTVTASATLTAGSHVLRLVEETGGYNLNWMAFAAPPSGATTQVLAINAGGGAASPFVADTDVSGGSTYSAGTAIDTSAVTNPAPQAVYQTERWGNFIYTLPGLMPGASYTLRLHFAEIVYGSPGQRQFNVLVNGTQVLTNFDIVAAAGGANKAIIKSFAATANSSGQIVVQFANGAVDNAKVDGLEVLSAGGSGSSVLGPGLFPTGVDNSGNALADGAADPHYTITSGPDGAGSAAKVTLSDRSPIGPWLSDSATSKWISPQADQSGGPEPPGAYVYRTTFNLTGFDPATVQVTGRMLADDQITDVQLNGKSLGITASGFTSWTSLNIGSGFQAGTNTLDFLVTNGGSSNNPSGLRVELSGTGKAVSTPPATLGEIHFYPRPGSPDRMTGGIFQGSNDNNTYTNLYTITSQPQDQTWTIVTLPADPSTYRYLRYLAPNNSYGNVAEVGFYTGTGASAVKIAGTGFGTPGSYDGASSDTFLGALDGNTNTFFDAPGPNGNFVGIDQGGPIAPGPGMVRFYPRLGSPDRMVGGIFQGSNDNSTYTNLYTITSQPADGAYTEAPLSADPKSFRYLRYLAPNNSYGNIAELAFYSGTGASAVKLSGLGFGTPGSYGNSGATFSSALDGDPTTAFDAPGPNGNFVGIDQQGQQMTLTPAGVSAGFSLTTFATGFPSVAGQIGPLGMAFTSSGGVMVADYAGNVRLFPDQDGQIADSIAPGVTPVSSFGQLNADGLAFAGGQFYLAQQGNGQVVRLNADGTAVTGSNAAVTAIASATDIAVNPANGHLFVSTGAGGGRVCDVNPATNSATVWPPTIPNADGLTVSADGATLYVAQISDSSGYGNIQGYSIANQTKTWDLNAVNPNAHITHIDGLAIGFGAFSGTIFANTNDGQLWQIALPSGQATLIASGGTRGDFAEPDASGQGSLLLTQSDRILRLSPFTPSGGGTVALSSLTVSPTTVAGGQSANGTVTLTGPAPSGGLTVNLSSSSASATAPASVFVAVGTTSAPFTIATTAVSASTSATFTAAYGGVTKQASLTITPPALTGVSLVPSSVVGGASSTGTLTLSSAAPQGGLSVSLSSGTPATVPGSVTVAAGASSAGFTVTTTAVQSQTTATVTATLLGVTKTASLVVTVPAVTIKSLSLSPNQVAGGYSSTATATLTGAAPASGLVLQLSSSSPTATVPATVTVSGGQSSVTFPVTTASVSAQVIATINATASGSSAAAFLTINPPSCVASPVSSFTVSPTSLNAGASLTGTVTLAAAAQNGGETINLSCDTPSALSVPATVFIPAGSLSNTFTATAQSIPVATTVHIAASYHGAVWMAAVNVAASASTGGPGTTQHLCGPMDVVFVLDSTGSMGSALGSVQSGLTSIISQIQSASGGDYRLGLIKFYNDVEVLDPLASGNSAKVQTDINALSAYGGGNYPQSSDVAALTAIDALPASYWIPGGLLQGSNPPIQNPSQAPYSPVNPAPLQSGDFNGGWRPGAQKIVILVTDANPSEFNNNNEYSNGIADPASVSYAHYVAKQAQAAGVLICAVNVASYESDISAVMRDYAGTSGGVYAFCQGGTGTGSALINIISQCASTPSAATGNIIATRDDRIQQYAPFSIVSSAVTAKSVQRASFDLVGFSGILPAANMQRSGQLTYTNDGPFDFQCGLLSEQAGGPATLSATLPAAALAASDPFIYSVNWPVTGQFLDELGNSLGGDYSAYLTDQLSSACGNYNIADLPHQNWPYQKNILTLKISPLSGIVAIPAGRCLDITLPGTDMPDNGAHWDILLSGQVVGSSGNPQGWDVEADHTLYYGVTVTVPANASASSNYEVRFVRQGADNAYQSSGSGGFSVTATDATLRAPLLKPLLLTLTSAPGAGPVTGVTGTASLTGLVSLDAPAPEEGATIVLTSSSSSAIVGAPGYVTIAPGKTSAQFSLSAQAVSSLTHVQILASYNGYRVASLTLLNPGGSLPTSLTLGAVPGNKFVSLSWSSVPSATSYTLVRGTHKGGPYSLLFSGLTGIAFVDKTVTNGTTYYYVVSAVNDYGSVSSNEASATPSGGQLPAPTFGSNPPGFTAQGSIQATISDAAQATIHYTLDGSTPSASSSTYSGPITLSSSTTIRAIAAQTGFAPSTVAAQLYTVTGLQTVVTVSTSCGGTLPGTLSASDGWSLVQGAGFYARDYQFAGAAGMTISLSIKPGSPPLDAVLFLIDPTGKVVAASNAASPQITLTLPATGTYTAEVSSYAPLETGAYTITLTCSVPQLTVQNGSTVLTSSSTATAASTVAFGNVAVGSTIAQTLTLRNTGTAELDLNQITMPVGFTLTQAPTNPILPGQSTSMVLSFAPTAAQNYSGPLTIFSNDPASPFTLTLTGTGTGSNTGGPALASLGLVPDPVTGGQNVTGKVTLTSAAPSPNGFAVTLTKSPDPNNVVGLPGSAVVTVLAGQTSQTFTLTTATVSAPATITINATDGTRTAQGLLTVQPPPLQPPTVTLTSPAPNSQFVAGTPVTLTALATAPSGTVTKVEFYASVNGGSNTKIGQATASPYTFVWPGTAGEQNASLTAVATDSNGLTTTSAAVPITFTSPVLASLQLSPDPVTGGSSVTGTVTLAAPAPTGGATVTLTTSDTTDTSLPSSASVTVGAGQTTATFTLTTTSVTTSKQAMIGASLGGGNASVTLIINPAQASAVPAIASLRLSPDPVQGGQSVTGTVTLTGPAPLRRRGCHSDDQRRNIHGAPQSSYGHSCRRSDHGKLCDHDHSRYRFGKCHCQRCLRRRNGFRHPGHQPGFASAASGSCFLAAFP